MVSIHHFFVAPFVCGVLVLSAAVARGQHPLEPPDTSSPRATLETFLMEANAAVRAVAETRDVRDDGEAARHVGRAVRCLDVSQVPEDQREQIGINTAVYLVDVLNRIPIPASEEVPDSAEMKKRDLTRWTLPRTPIVIARVNEGPRAGEWLFTPELTEHVDDYYRKTRDLPLKAGAAVGDAAALYSSLAGWMISPSWIASLPAWARAEYFGEFVWQWVALLVLLLIAGLVAVACVRWSVRASPEERPPLWRALLGPISLLVLCPVVSYLIDDQLWIGGVVRLALLRFLDALFYLAAAWGVLIVGRRTADAVASSLRLRLPINVQLVRVGIHVVSYVLVLVILLDWADHMGIPLLARLTGLGIGGIALAIAARKSIENVLGGLDLIADEPVRVGDTCRFGDTLGTVERIGLRSTRIRTPERTVVTIPNANLASLQLESFTHRDRSLFRTTLGLQLDATSEQIERVLSGVRELLLADENVLQETVRVGFVAVGTYSFDIEIRAYILTSDMDTFFAIRGRLLSRILREIEEADTGLAMPEQTIYVREPQAAAPPAVADIEPGSSEG